jgi:hypothetical protein
LPPLCGRYRERACSQALAEYLPSQGWRHSGVRRRCDQCQRWKASAGQAWLWHFLRPYVPLGASRWCLALGLTIGLLDGPRRRAQPSGTREFCLSLAESEGLRGLRGPRSVAAVIQCRVLSHLGGGSARHLCTGLADCLRTAASRAERTVDDVQDVGKG